MASMFSTVVRIGKHVYCSHVERHLIFIQSCVEVFITRCILFIIAFSYSIDMDMEDACC